MTGKKIEPWLEQSHLNCSVDTRTRLSFLFYGNYIRRTFKNFDICHFNESVNSNLITVINYLLKYLMISTVWYEF